MNKLQRFKDAAAKTKQGSFRSSKRNIALEVIDYDLTGSDPEKHFVRGFDLANNGEEVKVSLQALAQPLESGRTRLELTNLADASERKTHVKAGGVLMFESATQVGKGVYSANWASAMIHDPKKNIEHLTKDYSTVVLGAGRVNPRAPQDAPRNTAFVRTALSAKAEAFAANNLDAFKEYFKQAMSCPNGAGAYRPEAIVRIVMAEDGVQDTASVLLSRPFKDVEGEEHKQACSPEESLEMMLDPTSDRDDYKFFQMAVESLEESKDTPMEDLFIEVIPVVRRNFSPEQRKDFFAVKEVSVEGQDRTSLQNLRSDKGDRLWNRYHKPVDNPEEGQPKVTKLWFETIINTMNASEMIEEDNREIRQLIDYQFVKGMYTKDVFPRGYEDDYLPTKNFQPTEAMMIQRYSYDNNSESVQATQAVDEVVNSASTGTKPKEQAATNKTMVQQNQTPKQQAPTANEPTPQTTKPQTKPVVQEAQSAPQETVIPTSNADFLDDMDEDGLLDDLENLVNQGPASSPSPSM